MKNLIRQAKGNQLQEMLKKENEAFIENLQWKLDRAIEKGDQKLINSIINQLDKKGVSTIV